MVHLVVPDNVNDGDWRVRRHAIPARINLGGLTLFSKASVVVMVDRGAGMVYVFLHSAAHGFR